MSVFDSMFIGTILFGIIVFILNSPSIRKELTENYGNLSYEEENKLKIRLIKNRGIVVTIFVAIIVICISLAYHYNWESDILGINNIDYDNSNAESMETKESNKEYTVQPTETTELHTINPENYWNEIYESHSTDGGVSQQVSFRNWDSSSDCDLRLDSYASSGGASFLSHQSNLFNYLGNGGSENDRFISDIHFPIIMSSIAGKGSLVFSGLIVATQETQGSGAYADVAIIVDGIEQWRTQESITSDTVQPVSFSINISDDVSEIIIRTSCVPIGKGLALGYIGIHLSQSKVEENNSDSSNIPEPKEDIGQNGTLFVNIFETHSPNDVSSQIEFRNWDSFSDADLRDENYVNCGFMFMKISNLFNSLGSGGTSMITVEIHMPINAKWDLNGLIWTGKIVAEQRTQQSSAYADIAILVDGVEKWRTSESISGRTVPPIDFQVDLTNGEYELIIQIQCNALDSGLALGFISTDLEYN